MDSGDVEEAEALELGSDWLWFGGGVLAWPLGF